VGSTKANIGHLEGASGLAALIKTIYVLEKGIIPPQIWYEDTNPRIRLKEWNLAVPTEVTQWPYPGPRRASVNSFGFAGANAHAILEDAASYLKRSGKTGRHISKAAEESSHSPTRSQVSDDSGFSSVDDEISNVKAFPKLVVWSAHEQGGLNRISDSWKEYLSMKTSMYSQPEQYRLLRDLAYTASKKRTQFPWRSFAVCSNPEELATGQVDIAPPVRTSQKPKLAFVFTGQGAQHYAMGRRLMAYDAYAESLRAADKYLDSLGCPWSLVQELLHDAESSRINLAEFSQPLCIAVQVALVDLLRSLGVWPPELVIGHSGGETAAAYAKGALTRESAWKVAYHRGRVCSMVPDANPELELDGDMLAAGISEETAKEYIKDVKDVHGGELVVACVNSPTSVTFSGDVPVIIEAEKLIKADGHLAKRLGVNRAYHSGHMKVVADMYHDLLKDVKGLPETPDSPKMYSCVTGELIDNADLGGEYWVTNLLNQVKFSQAMTGLITHSNNRRAKQNRGYCSVNIMLEVGPHGALQGPVKQNLKAADAQCTTISVLDRKKDAAQSLLEAMGVLFQHGYQSDIAAANCPDSNDIPKPLVDLPPYPWNHSNRYWHESAVASSYRFKKFPRKDLLGLRDNEDNDNHPRWRHFLRLSENPWMEDHQVQGKVIYPAAGMLAMALEASREIADADRAVENFELRDVSIKAAIMIPSGEEGVETMLHMHPRASAGQDTGLARKEFSIYSRQAHNPWTLNCTGLVRIQYKFDASTEWFVDETKEASAMYRSGYQRARQNCRQSIRTDAFYSEQSELGLEFGETFQNVEDIHTSGREMVCAVRTPNVRQHMPHGFTHDHLIHPCTLDPIVHSCLAILNGGDFEKGASVPISIGRMMVSANVSAEPGTIFSVHSTAEPYGLRDGEVTIKASTTEWESPQIMFDQLRITRLGGGKSKNEGSDGMRKIASKIHWDVDVSYLKAMRHTSHNSPKEIGEAVGSLESFVRLLGHKHPDLKVLEVGAGTGEITETLLNALKGRDDESTPWLQLYRAATENAEDVKSLEKISNAWGPYFRAMQLETNRSWEEQALQPQDFDCIIIRANVESNDTDALLEKALSFLKDQGSLIILPSELFADSQDSWDQQLRKHNFTGIDYAVIEEYSSVQSLPFLVSSPDTGPGRIPDEVLIVGPSHPGPLFESLKQQLQPHGVEPVYTTLCHTQGMDLSTKHCVITSDLERPILFDISAKNFLLLKRLLLESQSILWVTSGATIECSEPKASLVTGLVRSINQEHPELSLTTLDVGPSRNDNEGDANIIIQLLQRAVAGDTDHEFSVRDGHLQIPRIRLDRELNHYSSVLRDGPRPEPGPLQPQGRNLALRLGVPGNVDSVYFMDNPPTQSPLAADDVEIEVKATGLSALDLQSAIDQARDPAFGYECSGVIKDVGSNVADFTPGNRVMTWCTGAFANTVRSPACLVQRMLIGMSFETAAALPINYCTAYQALVECARLVDGEKVLVHSAASGVGQAAIMIAQNLGAEVYVTVGSEAKRSHLMETYGLQEDHVFYSRGVDFLHGILRVTQSVGVDVVVNCLSGESVRHSGACLAPFGRFIEIGQKHSGRQCHDTGVWALTNSSQQSIRTSVRLLLGISHTMWWTSMASATRIPTGHRNCSRRPWDSV
jgi:acyl transferase domain-containing protein/NADPH:quinone reductase-like Zn-dependent oxidoreductase